jgi:hypothetical protein
MAGMRGWWGRLRRPRPVRLALAAAITALLWLAAASSPVIVPVTR